jgi:diguanylate cyclase (GGDEF)-like protein
VTDSQITPHRITKPIQLLAAWLAGLSIIDASFLTGATTIHQPDWVPGLLAVAAVLNVPLFLFCLFLLQTKFRPEMQEDSYYSRYWEHKYFAKPINSETKALKETATKDIESVNKELKKALDENNPQEQDEITQRIAERQHQKEQLEQAETLIYQATHDPLTDLYNRVAFLKSATDMLNYARSGNKRLAFLLFAIDSFRSINDTYGYDIGDKLLIASADRLKRIIGDDALLARLGGDEFVSVIEYFELHTVKAKLQKLVAAMSVPHVIGDEKKCISMSIGVSLYPLHGSTVDELLRAADLAMYQAKLQGKGRYVVFVDDGEG